MISLLWYHLLFICLPVLVAHPVVLNQSWMMKDKGSLDDPLPGSENICRRNATCVPANQTTCLGVRLPYQYTSGAVVGLSRHQILDRLKLLENLRSVPKCWAAIQPFLCALFLPKCDPESGLVDLPTYEMCKVAHWPCRILNDTLRSSLPFFDCDGPHRFPSDCKNDVKEMRFNTTGQCTSPFVSTDNPTSFYDGVEGCGVQCADPMLTDDERGQIHKMVAWSSTLALLCNVFTVASFLVEWRSSSKYPSVIIFYINFCFMISNFGWLAQFIPGAREDVVCRKDGTLRLFEPGSGENLSCAIVFVMVYYFLMAACVWFAILTYAWHVRFKTFNQIHVPFDKKGAYFHLVAWSLPLILTISTMALSQIGGNSVAGVCFVGYSSVMARIFLLIVPVTIAAVVGVFFLSLVLFSLFCLTKGSQNVICEKARKKIRCSIIRVALFLVLCVIFVIAFLFCQFYEFHNQEEWKKSFRKYVLCHINPFEEYECKIQSRPSVAMIQVQLLVLFMSGVLMSFWVWTSSTRETWKRSLKRMFSSKVQTRAAIKKHKLIALAWEKRKELEDAGRLSISIHETHTDPVGLNFELNSVESQDFSSTWAAALPKLVTRRGALIDATTESNSSHHHRRRNSYDSEISYSVRRVSVESRRHSLDSQISVQIAEVTATRKTSSTPRPHSEGRSRRRGRRRDCGRGRRNQRRGSSTSQESQLGMQILTAMTMRNPNIIPSLLTRRHGNAGLDSSPGLGCALPMLQIKRSDDEFTHGEIIQDEDQSFATDDDLCILGQGIQSLRVRESDSDAASVRRPRSSALPLPPSESKKRHSDSDRVKGKSKKSDSQGHKPRWSKSELSSSVRRKGTRKRSQARKTDDWEMRRSRESSGRSKRRSEGEDKFAARKTECSEEGASDFITDSETAYSDVRHSIGIQAAAGGKRSVDVATQVVAQEIATQTDPEPRDVALQTHNGTQMTPPLHIRLINKSFMSNGHYATMTHKNYSYSALSLTDPGSDAPK